MASSLSSEELIAHSPGAAGDPQPLIDHLAGVARLAEAFTGKYGCEEVGRWLGWWHDAGKVAPDCQAYLRAPDERARGPDHSSAGAIKARQVLEPLAFNVAGHHGGLTDREALRKRLQRKEGSDRVGRAVESAEEFLDHVPSPDPDLVRERISASPDQKRALEFWIRMMHSALVDADCLDTERHFDPEDATRRVQEKAGLAELWERLEDDQERLISEATGHVNEVRECIYRDCTAAASFPPGLFSLTVPTGGGKTRSAMAFALKHALAHGLDRVVVVLPYTSIIEQNVQVYRAILGADVVVEHHSAVSSREEAGEAGTAERWQRLAADNWDAEVVVTTSVQFFESLFSNRNSKLRKLHNVVRSVVVLDEIQVFPPELLSETLWVLQHLVDAYGCTVALSSATQPALAEREGFDGLRNVREIVEEPEDHFEALRRVHYRIDVDGGWNWEEVANRLRGEDQALAVVNTVADARALVEALEDGADVLHLSSRLCGAHRSRVLKEIRSRLNEGRRVRVVSTQVVEAGVDLDFPLVLRALGPLDSIVQAAGRCNREGRADLGEVVVFRPEDGGVPPGSYRVATDVTSMMLRAEPELDLHDPDVYLEFFSHLYDARNLDQERIGPDRERLRFEKVDRKYRLIDEESGSVLVAHGDGNDWIGRLEDGLESGQRPSAAVFRKLQPYLVSLRMDLIERATREGFAREILPGLWTWRGAYDAVTGLEFRPPGPAGLTV